MLGRYELSGDDSSTGVKHVSTSAINAVLVIAGVVAIGFLSEFVKTELKKKVYESREKKRTRKKASPYIPSARKKRRSKKKKTGFFGKLKRRK